MTNRLVARIQASLRRRRRLRLVRWTWVAAVPLALYLGASLVGVRFEGLGPAFAPRAINLTSAVPATVHTSFLPISGTTQPNALITAIVDGSRLPSAIAGDDGAFQLTIDLGPGIHRIRLEVAYGSPDRPNELLEAVITRVSDPPPTPVVIAVERQTDPNAFAVLLRSTPRTTIVTTGATPSPPDPRIDDSGRARIFLRVDQPGAPVTLSTRDDQGGTSVPTTPLDLAQLSESPPPIPPFEAAEWNVSFLLTRDGITRTQSVAIDKRRPEVADYTRGAISAATFLREAGGVAGLAPPGNFGCLVSSISPARSDLEIGDRANVTLADEFPELLTAWNGLTDRPRISLCFPAGFPGLGNSGTIELKVRDYAVAAASEQVATAAIDTLGSGQLERTYTWNAVPRSGAIELTLDLDAPSVIAALPVVRPRTLFGDEGLGRFFMGVIDALIVGAGVVLLIWATTSSKAKARLSAAPRRALAGVLMLGAALMFLPVFGELQELGVSAANQLEQIRDIAAESGTDPSMIGRWFVALVVFVVSLAFGLVVWRKFEFGGRAALAIAGAAAGSLGISMLAWFGVAAIYRDGTPPELAVRIVTWVVGALGLGIVLAIAAKLFADLLGRRNRLAAIRSWPIRLGWVAFAALLLAIPAGTEQAIPTSLEGAAQYVESTVTSLARLVAFAYPLVAIAAVALLVREVWGSAPWEETLSGAPDEPKVAIPRLVLWRSDARVQWLAPQIGRALFAGFVIGTAGVLLPVPFVLALFFFGFVLRPAAEIAGLARQAPDLRKERTTKVAADFGSAEAAGRLDLLQWHTRVSAGPAELGPEPSVWANVRHALRVAFVLVVPLLLIYIARYPFASMTRQDEYFIQRLLLNIVTFAGTWLTIALVFALLYEYLRGTTGVRKGLWFGFTILALTVPWQLLSGLATTISPVGIGIHVFEVLTFTGLIGAAFDLRILLQGGRADFSHPRELLHNVGVFSGLPDIAAAIALIVAAVGTTVLSLLTGQVTQLLTRVLSPFLPMPPTGGP